MKLQRTKIQDLLLVKTNIFKDKRGFFKEVEQFKILKKKFIFDCLSFSKKNTLRGLHLQKKKKQAKIITVAQGKILDVAVDLRKKSKTYENIFRLKYHTTQIFLYLYQKVLLMALCVYPKHVWFIISVQIIVTKKVK